jgi:glutamate dehydrogenase
MTSPRAAKTAAQPEFSIDIEKLLVAGALPGELEGFGKQARSEAAAFLLGALAKRVPGKPVIVLETVATDSTRRQMRLAVVNDDMPFLVDSISAEVASHGLSIARVLHPVLRVARDSAGRLTAIHRKAAEGVLRESLIYMEIDRADAKTRRDIENALKTVLGAVRVAVADWHKLQASMRSDAGTLASEEGAQLLRWFGDNNFTMLGHARFVRSGAMEAPLGIAQLLGPNMLSAQARKRAFAWFDKGGEQPLVLKSNLLSPVHRRVPIELVLVPHGKAGRATALSVHAGMWTSAALNTPPGGIPVLRQRLAGLQTKFGFDPTGHAGKALGHALTALPHDMLIAMDIPSLEGLALTAMSLADRPRGSVAITRSPLGRHLNAFVWLPRDDVTTNRRLTIAALLSEAARAPILSWSIHLDDSGIALIRFTLDIREGGGVPDVAKLNAQLEAMLRGWKPAVEAALVQQGHAAAAARLAIRPPTAKVQARKKARGIS